MEDIETLLSIRKDLLNRLKPVDKETLKEKIEKERLAILRVKEKKGAWK